jgi:hypothetical protein
LNAASGVISGVALRTGVYSFTVKAENAGGSHQKALKITIAASFDTSGKPNLAADPVAANPLDLATLPADSAHAGDKVWAGSKINKGFAIKITYRVKGSLIVRALRENTDYTVIKSGSNKNIGKGSITIAGKAGSAFKGSKPVNFNILPKSPSKVKLTAGKKQLTVKWAKPSQFA